VKPEERFTALTNHLTGGLMLIEKEPDIFYVNKGNGRLGPISWTGGAFVDEQQTNCHPPLVGVDCDVSRFE
jgi:hypothetical protein